jgi:hypothetical protein
MTQPERGGCLVPLIPISLTAASGAFYRVDSDNGPGEWPRLASIATRVIEIDWWARNQRKQLVADKQLIRSIDDVSMPNCCPCEEETNHTGTLPQIRFSAFSSVRSTGLGIRRTSNSWKTWYLIILP